MTGTASEVGGFDQAGDHDLTPRQVGRVLSGSASATAALGAALAGACGAGDLVVLIGGLGAGKTTFAQGFARGLGVTERVTSPTFVLVREYEIDPAIPGATAGIDRLLHADLYRLDDPREMDELAIHEALDEGAVAVVEWGERGASVLGREVMLVELERAVGADDGERRVTVSTVGRGWSARHELVKAVLDGGGPPRDRITG